MIEHYIATSFVHGYSDPEFEVNKDQLPALWVHGPNYEAIHSYPFPRNLADFETHKELIAGVMPLPSGEEFNKLPRFGLTGLVVQGEHLYAGSWNSVYEIRKSDYVLQRIITNPLMNDMHGIWVDEEYLITILTGKDTVVINDYQGRVIDHFTVANDLSIYKNEKLEQVDWRFISKQFRGATGLWHFNYVQRFDDEIWLTARNLGAFIVVNLRTRKAHIRTMNQKTAVMLHDGVLYNGEYYFTSIDGKIIIAAEDLSATFNPREKFTRDMVCDLIRIEETEFGRAPNWCRGISCHDDVMYIAIDGRYDTNLSFGILGLKRNGEKVMEKRLDWRTIGSEEDLRYVTGFDVVTYL